MTRYGPDGSAHLAPSHPTFHACGVFLADSSVQELIPGFEAMTDVVARTSERSSNVSEGGCIKASFLKDFAGIHDDPRTLGGWGHDGQFWFLRYD